MTDSFAFCRELLEETRVGLAPGVAFGDGRRGILPHLLRRGTEYPGACHGAIDEVLCGDAHI